MLIWGKAKPCMYILKTDDVKLFTDMLTNKMFSKHILSCNFKTELF